MASDAWGRGLLGGVMDPEIADELHDRLHETDPNAVEGLSLREVREAAGFHGALGSVKLPPHYYDAWVELHIEQGPLLERDNVELGIVTNIAAPASYRYTVEGFGGHAGALLMPRSTRCDVRGVGDDSFGGASRAGGKCACQG